MYNYFLFIAVLSAILLPIPCQETFQPYGPKMCDVRCEHTKCPQHIFDQVQLTCRLATAVPATGYSRASIGCYNDVTLYEKTITTWNETAKNISNVGGSICPPVDVKIFLGYCETGNLTEVKRLVCQGIVDVDCHGGEDSSTGVMLAASNNNVDVFDFLVEQNCDLSAVDSQNNSVIHYACFGNCVYILKKLVNDHKINIEHRGYRWKTPVMFAIEVSNMELLKAFVDCGADITAVDSKNDTVIHQALKCFKFDFVSFFLSLNIIDIESKGQDGRTPLMTAVSSNNVPYVRVLKEKGADVYVKDNYNNTLLNLACEGDEDMVRYILSLNVTDLEGRGQSGKTPLMNAAHNGNLKVFKLLTRRGANVYTVDDNNNTVLHLACESGDSSLVVYVLSMKIIDIEVRGHLGRTPLLDASCYGNAEVVKLLKRRGAHVNKLDDLNNTILHLACQSGSFDLLKYVLILSRIDIDSKGENGRTALMIAVATDVIPFVDLLMNKGADASVVDDGGRNVLHIACQKGLVEMVHHLLALRNLEEAVKRKDKTGLTPLAIAEQEGFGPIVDLLTHEEIQ